jgi:hypothetical protein
MALLYFTLLPALLALEVPDLLREPGYIITKEGHYWAVRKPGMGSRLPVTISQHRHRSAAELRKRSLPRLRLDGLFVRFDPATFERTVIADWTDQEDAQAIGADVREILNRFAPAGILALLQSTPVYVARLFGATGHTAEESTDPTQFVIYMDPFRATGRLHAASTLLHELTHLERYRTRGFHANRAAAVLPKADFVLLGLADEFGAYQAEANLVRSLFDSHAKAKPGHQAGEGIGDEELSWPLAVKVLLGLEGPSDEANRIMEARRQVVLDLARTAGHYWDARHTDPIDPKLRQMIQNWHESSREWKEIDAERPEWEEAETLGYRPLKTDSLRSKTERQPQR